jgi:hypothetical protein
MGVKVQPLGIHFPNVGLVAGVELQTGGVTPVGQPDVDFPVSLDCFDVASAEGLEDVEEFVVFKEGTAVGFDSLNLDFFTTLDDRVGSLDCFALDVAF